MSLYNLSWINILCCYRFIDNLFLIGTRTESLLIKFIDHLNTNQSNFRLTLSYDYNNIPFLDLKIIKDPTGQIEADFYCTPTAGNTLLHVSGAHPHPLVLSIPYVQYLRLRRNCTEDWNFYIQAAVLRERLLAWGYIWTNLRKAYNKAFAQTILSLLNGPPHIKQPETVKIVSKFSARHNQLWNLLSDHWHLLTDHHVLGKNVRPISELGFRRETSLRDRLTSSHYRVEPRGGGRRPPGALSVMATVNVACGFRRAQPSFFLMENSSPLPNMPTAAWGELYI